MQNPIDFAVQEISQKPMVFGALEYEVFGASKAMLSNARKSSIFANFDFLQYRKIVDFSSTIKTVYLHM